MLRENRDILIDKGLLNVAVFGSVARGDEKPGSDIYLLVKVPDDMNASPWRESNRIYRKFRAQVSNS